jgi:hypothetical protein
LTLHDDGSLPAVKVNAELDRVFVRCGKPLMITCDSGTEFTSNHFDAWAYARKIALDGYATLPRRVWYPTWYPLVPRAT